MDPRAAFCPIHEDIAYSFCFTGAETETHNIDDDSKIKKQRTSIAAIRGLLQTFATFPDPLGSRKLNKRAPSNVKKCILHLFKKIVKFLDISRKCQTNDCVQHNRSQLFSSGVWILIRVITVIGSRCSPCIQSLNRLLACTYIGSHQSLHPAHAPSSDWATLCYCLLVFKTLVCAVLEVYSVHKYTLNVHIHTILGMRKHLKIMCFLILNHW
jgi:hypothetical protein